MYLEEAHLESSLLWAFPMHALLSIAVFSLFGVRTSGLFFSLRNQRHLAILVSLLTHTCVFALMPIPHTHAHAGSPDDFERVSAARGSAAD